MSPPSPCIGARLTRTAGRSVSWLAAFAVIASSGGCLLTQDIPDPALDVPPAYKSGARTDLDAPPPLDWWRGFSSPELTLLMEEAQRVNLDRGRPLSPVLDECVSAILTQVKLLRQISAEFSSFASSPTPRPEPTDLRSLMDDVVKSYLPGLAARVTVDVQAAPDLPQVSIDRTLFAPALTNLIENALVAMPGGGTLTIAARSEGAPPERSVVVTVTDTGAGMDKEALGRIFEPYFSTTK